MRKLAWLVMILLFLLSALFFVRYTNLTARVTSPDGRMLLELSQLLLRHGPIRQAAEAVGYLRGGEESVDVALHVSIGLASLGLLSFVVLAAVHRRRQRSEYDYFDESPRGSQSCPQCAERIRGFEIVCRACGSYLVKLSQSGRRIA
jgi:hypothetical protein